MTLLIDTSAASVKPDDNDLREWLSEQRVFISSVMSGLENLRADLADAIQKTGAIPVYFEKFGGRDDDANAAYLGGVRSATIYLGVLSRDYGTIQKSRMSATHEEYREAEQQGLPISVWTDRKADFDADQRKLLNEIQLFHTTGSYDGTEQLCQEVVTRLREIAAAELSPWVKLNDAVFRARFIRDNGAKLTLGATIRSAVVVAFLEALRPGDWGVRKETRLTFNGQSLRVKIDSVHTEMTSSRAVRLEIEMEHALDAEAGSPMTANLNVFDRRSKSDIDQLLVRRALFGEEIPPTLMVPGGRIQDPFTDLPSALGSDEVARAVIRLLIVEALIKSGRVARVVNMRVGPKGPNGRQAIIQWLRSAGRNTTVALQVDGRLAIDR